MTVRLRGLTWGHRRAIDPLAGTLPAFAALRPRIEIAWDVQPLAGFEAEPVAALAQRYDLLVFDHPHIGDAVAAGALLPLDTVAGNDDAYPGPQLASYRMAGHVWAVPIDAACQVAAYRPDLLEGPVPATWEEVFALGEAQRARGRSLAMALTGVHGLMTFFTLCAGEGMACAIDPGRPFVDPAPAHAALAAMRCLAALCPPEVLGWNSIAVQDAMAARDDLVYCPAVYGFATYAEADRPRPLRFGPLPGVRGSAIGGAGLGVSAHTRERDATLAYARFAAQPATQRAFAAHHGQPAHRAAWTDPEVDARFGGFFGATRATLEGAWVRPRYPGYPAFQKDAGMLIESHLRGGLEEGQLLAGLQALHAGGAS